MAKVPWKKGAILSIDTERGVFCLAQMLDDPYLAIFNVFRTDEQWPEVKLDPSNVLFINPVTRQFLTKSNISKPKIAPVADLEAPLLWIEEHFGSGKLRLWPGTADERVIPTLNSRPGGRLVKNYRDAEFGKSEVIIEDIALDDSDTIDRHEMTAVRIYREFNERIYLCHKFGRNVDPIRDMAFNREIPLDYKDYIDIIMS